MRSKNRVRLATILAGATVTSLAMADQVINDDLIVLMSECVGTDCVNGEDFGFDTLRLKENNLRIHFLDTSNSGSFPSNDWRLTANDNANGGLNRFSIDDATAGNSPFTVEAGAGANALYVDDGGRVGVGTSSPVVEVHVADGDSPTLRLEQNGSSGFTPQTWDIAGNEANFFVRDVTNGSRLPFKIKPGAPTDSLFVAADGNIAIGHSSVSSGSGADRVVELRQTNGSTSFTLDYNGTQKFGEVTFEENNTAKWSIGSSVNNAFFYVFSYTRNQTDISIAEATGNVGLGGITVPNHPLEHANGAHLSAGGVWQDASSRSLKHDIKPLSSGAAKDALMALKPVSFRYNTDPKDEVVGFIAEDVPDLVATESRKTLSSMDIVAVLAKVVQEQQTTINELQKSVEKLKAKQATSSR